MISVCMRCEREGGTERAAEERERERERYIIITCYAIFFLSSFSLLLYYYTRKRRLPHSTYSVNASLVCFIQVPKI